MLNGGWEAFNSTMLKTTKPCHAAALLLQTLPRRLNIFL